MDYVKRQLKCAKLFLIEFLIVEVLSVLLFMLAFGGLAGFFGGLLAPIWGVVVMMIVWWTPSDPLSQQLLIPSGILALSLVLMGLALFGRINRWIGAVAMLVYCLLSMVVLIGLSD